MPWGFVDERGEWLIEPAWERAGTFCEGLAWVVRDGRLGYVDAEGALAVPLRFATAGAFRGGLADVSEDGSRTFVINRAGDHVYATRKVLAGGTNLVGRVDEDQRVLWGAVRDGDEFIALEHRTIRSAHGFFIVSTEGEEGARVLDDQGTLIYEAPRRVGSPFQQLRRLGDRWLAKYADESGGLLVFMNADFETVAEHHGDELRVLEGGGPARYEIRRRNDRSLPEAGIFRGKATTIHLDEALEPVDPPPDKAAGGLRLVPVGRKKDLQLDGVSIGDGPFDDAHLQRSPEGDVRYVIVARKTGKKKAWGTLDAHGNVLIPTEHHMFDASGLQPVLGSLGQVGLVGGDGTFALHPEHTAARALGPAINRAGIYVGGKAYKNGNLKGGSWAIVEVPGGAAVTEPRFTQLGPRYSDGRLSACVAEP